MRRTLNPTSRGLVVALFVGVGAVTTLAADTVRVAPSKDNSLFESSIGSLSNGGGIYLFTGITRQAPADNARRALLAFDVAGALPAGARITNVTLTLTMNRTIAADSDVSVHRVLRDWGEGASNAAGDEGSGTASQASDATWIHTFFPGDRWNAAGGDFAPAASASTEVAGNGPYSWTSPELAADVRGWLALPASNFGWLLLGDEQGEVTAKRWGSRENPSDSPVLEIEFELAPPPKVPATTPWTLGALAAGIVTLGAIALRRQSRGATD